MHSVYQVKAKNRHVRRGGFCFALVMRRSGNQSLESHRLVDRSADELYSWCRFLADKESRNRYPFLRMGSDSPRIIPGER